MVERHLAKVMVAGSSPVSRSIFLGWNSLLTMQAADDNIKAKGGIAKW